MGKFFPKYAIQQNKGQSATLLRRPPGATFFLRRLHGDIITASDFLFEAAREAEKIDEQCSTRMLVQIHSAADYHTRTMRQNSEFAKALRECLKGDVLILYAIQGLLTNALPFADVVKGLQKFYGKLISRILREGGLLNPSEEASKEKSDSLRSLVYVLYEPCFPLPRYQDAFARIATMSRCDEIRLDAGHPLLTMENIAKSVHKEIILEQFADDTSGEEGQGLDQFDCLKVYNKNYDALQELCTRRHDMFSKAHATNSNYRIFNLFDAELIEVNSLRNIEREQTQAAQLLFAQIILREVANDGDGAKKEQARDALDILKRDRSNR